MTSTDDVTSTPQVTPSEFKALVAIETAERLAVKAHGSIQMGDLDEAKRLLVALADVTTTRTVTAVKEQTLSDAISAKAREAVATVMNHQPPLNDEG